MECKPFSPLMCREFSAAALLPHPIPTPPSRTRTLVAHRVPGDLDTLVVPPPPGPCTVLGRHYDKIPCLRQQGTRFTLHAPLH